MMPKGYPNPKPVEQPEAPVPLRAVKLLRNYRPMGNYEIVGWHKPAVEKKLPSGKVEEVEPSEFISGSMAPAPVAGAVGFANKIWANTVIRLPIDEAKTVVRQQIGALEFDDAG